MRLEPGPRQEDLGASTSTADRAACSEYSDELQRGSLKYCTQHARCTQAHGSVEEKNVESTQEAEGPALASELANVDRPLWSRSRSPHCSCERLGVGRALVIEKRFNPFTRCRLARVVEHIKRGLRMGIQPIRDRLNSGGSVEFSRDLARSPAELLQTQHGRVAGLLP